MSFSISDCFSDLLCAEDSAGALSSDSPAESQPFFNSPAPFSDEQSLAGFHHLAELRPIPLESSARSHLVSWILKVRAFYGFHELTAYLAVNYFDRFLCSYRLPKSNGWTLQLLSVACLSLAAKMEEPFVPLLHHFQVEGATFIFSPSTIQKMELLVLDVLHWRLRSVTPLSYIGFFTSKADTTTRFTGFLSLRATDIILSSLQEASLLEHRPSSIAAAAVLWAASEVPNLPLVTLEHAESWCDGLTKEKVIDCYKVMQHVVMKQAMESSDRKRVLSSSCCTSDWSCSLSSVSSCSSYCSSMSASYADSTKRRKLSESSCGFAA